MFGFKTAFGGGKSTGFALIYDNLESANRYEPRYRKIRVCFHLLCHSSACLVTL